MPLRPDAERQILIGVSVSLVSAILTAVIVFSLLVMRKRIKDKQLLLWHVQRMRSSIPFRRSHSESLGSAVSAAGYSAGFRGPAAGVQGQGPQTRGGLLGGARPGGGRPRNGSVDPIERRRQMRKATAYNRRSFSGSSTGAGGGVIMDPWDHVLPGRSRPLHISHDPFSGRSRGSSTALLQDSISSAPPSEGQPAVAAFRSANFPVSPTTFYTYEGRIANTLHGYDNAADSLSRHRANAGAASPRDQGRKSRGAYFGRKFSSNSSDTADSGSYRAVGSVSDTRGSARGRQYRKKGSAQPRAQAYSHAGSRLGFHWRSPPVRQSYRDPGYEQRQQQAKRGKSKHALRRTSLEGAAPSTANESWDWAPSSHQTHVNHHGPEPSSSPSPPLSPARIPPPPPGRSRSPSASPAIPPRRGVPLPPPEIATPRRRSPSPPSSSRRRPSWNRTPSPPSPTRRASPPLPSPTRRRPSYRRQTSLEAPSSRESVSWAGVEPTWRSTNSSEVSSGKRRSGSYDELERRTLHRQRYESTGEAEDDLAVFNWMPTRGPVITLDHHPSSTYDGDVSIEREPGGGTNAYNSRGFSRQVSGVTMATTTATTDDHDLHRISATSSEADVDSAFFSKEDLPKFTKSTAKLELSSERTNVALQLEEMYY